MSPDWIESRQKSRQTCRRERPSVLMITKDEAVSSPTTSAYEWLRCNTGESNIRAPYEAPGGKLREVLFWIGRQDIVRLNFVQAMTDLAQLLCLLFKVWFAKCSNGGEGKESERRVAASKRSKIKLLKVGGYLIRGLTNRGLPRKKKSWAASIDARVSC